jgi:hypothetical protein
MPKMAGFGLRTPTSHESTTTSKSSSTGSSWRHPDASRMLLVTTPVR